MSSLDQDHSIESFLDVYDAFGRFEGNISEGVLTPGDGTPFSVQPPTYRFPNALRRLPDAEGKPTPWFAYLPKPLDHEDYATHMFYPDSEGQRLFREHAFFLAGLEVFDNPEYYLSQLASREIPQEGVETMRRDLLYYGQELSDRLLFGSVILPQISSWHDLGFLFPHYGSLARHLSSHGDASKMSIRFGRTSWEQGSKGAIQTAFGGAELCYEMESALDYPHVLTDVRILTQARDDISALSSIRVWEPIFRERFGAGSVRLNRRDHPDDVKLATELMLDLLARYPRHFGEDLGLLRSRLMPDPLSPEEKNTITQIYERILDLPDKIRHNPDRFCAYISPQDAVFIARLYNQATTREVLRRPELFYAPENQPFNAPWVSQSLTDALHRIDVSFGYILVDILDTNTPWHDGKVTWTPRKDPVQPRRGMMGLIDRILGRNVE